MIYLDYNATTPVADEVAEATARALRELWGNPSSDHAAGRRAHEAVELARAEVAALLGAHPDEIVFTGGGTESDNAALIGTAEARATRGRHLVTSNVEHPAVEQACAYLERRGWTIDRAAVSPGGAVTVDGTSRLFRDDTTLVSVMHANNETGMINPIAEISGAARARGIVVHTDAAQSVGKIPVDVAQLDVDLLTLAGHKLYAPKGIGALYVRRGTPFAPFLHGAGHESGRRAGTEATPLIVGLGVACRLASRELGRHPARLARLRDRLVAGLRAGRPDLVVHGSAASRLPNTASVALPGVDAARLVASLDDVATAAGAACHAGTHEPSRVLLAMGVDRELALATLRLTVGRPTTESEVDTAIAAILEAAPRYSSPVNRESDSA